MSARDVALGTMLATMFDIGLVAGEVILGALLRCCLGMQVDSRIMVQVKIKGLRNFGENPQVVQFSIEPASMKLAIRRMTSACRHWRTHVNSDFDLTPSISASSSGFITIWMLN